MLRTAVLLAAIAVTGVTVVVATSRRAPERVGDLAPRPPCGGFDFPVGAPDADGYYDAQPFGRNDHLGNDWNGLGGRDTDLGDPVYAVADGIVLDASDQGEGWGTVVRVVHPCAGTLESLYAHLDTTSVVPGQRVTRGDRIGTIGTAGGRYLAHLHFEMRARPLPLGGGYSAEREGFVDATAYIRDHRPRWLTSVSWRPTRGTSAE